MQMIGVLLIERKEGTAVLQDDPSVATNHGAAKVVIDRLDQRRDHSALVGGAEVAGVAVRSSPLVGLRVGNTRGNFGDVECALWINQATALVGIRLADKELHRNIHNAMCSQ